MAPGDSSACSGPSYLSGTVSLESRHAFHFLEPLPDEFHGTFVVNQVVLADSIFPFEFTGLPRALFQPKELNRRDAKRDFESPHLIVNRSLLCIQQVLDLRSGLSWSCVHRHTKKAGALSEYITGVDRATQYHSIASRQISTEPE